MITTPIIVFLVLLVAKLVMELWLSALNRKEVLANKTAIPEAYRDVVDEETYRKSIDYTLAKNAFGRISGVYDSIVLALIVATGFLGWFYGVMTEMIGTGIWQQAIVLSVVMILTSLPSIPTDLWFNFKIEEKFGFNKMTAKLWITDQIKNMCVGLAIGIPVLALLLAIFHWLPDTWWLWGFVAMLVIQIVGIVLHPRVIMPLYNKMWPLEDGDLKVRLLGLGERLGFSAKTIMVMDGSKRSAHSNAFFTGFGKYRKIVLYDTLIEQMEDVQLEAVLAHEIGHNKCGHSPKTLGVMSGFLLGAFGLMYWLSGQAWFYEGFGFDANAGMGPLILLVPILLGLALFWFSPLFNILSRKHEYEADAFAREAMGNDPEPLIKGLHVMFEKNLSNLTPHPTFSWFYYSHPNLQEREAALRNG